jgi:hypothetical protein
MDFVKPLGGGICLPKGTFSTIHLLALGKKPGPKYYHSRAGGFSIPKSHP